ncbi:MAG TPA: hypothetical protein PKJ47_07125 [Candidatus Limiplasma sp.]|nr:hypothetical protein [Candidatus Limiplasma sp.]
MYKTENYTFRIRKIVDGSFGIFVNRNDLCFESCDSVSTAIKFIQEGITGDCMWDGVDFLAEGGVPSDIAKWTYVEY